MAKGSSCVESLREITDLAAKAFGADRTHRRHKEKKFYHDVRVLAELMFSEKVYMETTGDNRRIWSKSKGKGEEATPAIVDIMAIGKLRWCNGKMEHYVKSTTYDVADCYPLSLLKSNRQE